MAIHDMPRFALWLAFLFFEHVLQSKEFAILMAVFIFLSVVIFVAFVVWTLRPKAPDSFHIPRVSSGIRKIERLQRGSSRKQQQGSNSNATRPTEGDISNYVEFDDEPPVSSRGYTTTSRLQNIPEQEPAVVCRGIDYQGSTNPNTMSPMVCETTAEIEPSGNMGDVKICLTLKSSDVKYYQTPAQPREANVNRSHSDRLPMRENEYMTPDDARSGSAGAAGDRSMQRSRTLPRLHVTSPADQSGDAQKNDKIAQKNGKKANYLDLAHEYMPMGNVPEYTYMDSVLGLNALYEN
ncbi:uncharacterized protein LOC121420466 isoform X1 [Lytechinus variegatus]|uniref:uncharacterized protein LOC121420466 isoform X1 n=1 Tax=Lytechinus variegatus TaxID=7654 RepID=UPI001BB0F26C|nr:uncharacterized protein LOC121420466 isoform X1 [Lytechinus variegatus]